MSSHNDLSFRRLCHVLMAVAIVASGILHWGTGRWSVEIQPDSLSYLEFDWSSGEAIFRGIRTPGYPLFLEGTAGLLGVEAVPVAHWLVLMGAVCIWRNGLMTQGFHPFTALCASVPLLFSAATWELGASIASDSLGVSLCIAACGWFLAALAPQTSVWRWVIVGLATLAAIVVRPAYLYLLLLWPILSCWLSGVVWRLPRGVMLRNVVAASLAACVPFLGYCGLRYVVVGEFGLVSFAGYNLIGVTGQWISDEDLPAFEGPSRELAQQMMSLRSHVEDYAPPNDYETMARLYNATVWGTAAPAAESIYGKDTEASNAALRALALQSLAMHPWEYAKWLVHNAKRMLDQLLRQAFSDCGARIAILGLTVFLLVSVLAPRGWGWKNAVQKSLPSLSSSGWSKEWSLLWWVTLSMVCAKGLLVILVEPALGRYVVAVGWTVPSLVGWVCGLLATLSTPHPVGN